MTNDEAIIVLKYGMKYHNPKNDAEKDRNEALEMAISALKENKGEWIFDEILDQHYYCSECKSMGVSYWDYCPYCGADMRGE